MTSNRRTPGTQGDNDMNTNRRAAIFVGIMFICATVSAMLGLLYFYQPILTGPDYLINGAAHTNEVLLGGFRQISVEMTIPPTLWYPRRL